MLLLACSAPDGIQIDLPGYPACHPGDGGDLGTTEKAHLTVTVHPGDVHQELLGFGASDCWSIQHVGQWPLETRSAIADLLFETGIDEVGAPRGIGLSVWRFNIGAASSRQEHISREWRRADTFYNDDFTDYDWTRLPGQRWFLQAALDRGVDRFVAFVNSPPVNMTKNGRAFCDAGSGTTNLADGMEDDFSGYLADIVRHFKDVEGIDFDVLSPFNEPQWDWEAGSQEGCRYSVEDMKRVIDLLADEPGLAGTELEIPESGSILDLAEGAGYLEAFFHPESAAFSGDRVAPRITAHSYKTDLPSTGLVDRRLELRSALDRYPGLHYAMTEFCLLGEHGPGRDLGIDTALHVARVIHFDLVIAEATSWEWWLAVSPYDYKDGLVFIDRRTTCGEYDESKTLWAMGNFSRFVRPGMVRIGVTRSDRAAHVATVNGLMVSSFYDRNLGVVATVFVNWSGEDVPVDLETEASEIDWWIPYVTSATNNLSAYAAVAGGDTVAVPARSIVTLVGHEASSKGASGHGSRRAVSEP
jgi:O-glycosyl hydrolase